MIKIDSLRFAFSGFEFILSISELNIDQGEKVAVIGPSGSGKSTLLNLVSGILIPRHGTVQCAGTEISALSDRQRRDFRISTIGFVFQNFELIDYLNGYDNILHPFRISGRLQLTGKVRERAFELARLMNIENKLRKRVDQLSQGEKQRIAICRALLPSPKIVLADEATGNLDPRNKELILKLLLQCVELHKATLLAVTHDHELLQYFDRVVDFSDFRPVV